MVFDIKTLATGIGAALIAASLGLGSAIAKEQSDAAPDTAAEEATAEAEMSQEDFRAERTNSCEEVGRESAGWTLNVAYDHDPRHTPCVTDRGSRIRHSRGN